MMMLGNYIQNLKNSSLRSFAAYFALSLIFMAISSTASAQDVSTVAVNITDSTEDLPGLVSAFAYLLGLIFGIRGILKLKAHVENPGNGSGQTPLRTPFISFIIGGALFALPMILRVAQTTIDGGSGGGFGASLSLALAGISTLFGGLTPVAGDDFNSILSNIGISLLTVPGLISAFSYLFGIVLVVLGTIKVKEHVETPEQTKLSEAVIRILIGGALLAMPTIYNAMFNTVDGTGGVWTLISFFTGTFTSDFIGNCTAGSTGLGQRICGIVTHTGAFPAFLTGMAYIFGLVMGVWGVLKIRDHVLNPQQTGVFEGISRLIAGGAFFALPFVVQVFTNTIAGGGIGGAAYTSYNYGSGTLAGYVSTLLSSGSCPASALGLDALMLCFASDILGPVHVLLNFFAFVAGIIFIMIGISRLIKGAQEGAKAPGGLGTLMTFAIGGALISYNDIIRAATTTFTGSTTTQTFAKMQYTTGMTPAETAAAHAVITSIIKFMIVVGIISFVRGLFIVRSVAEGNQQASMMAGVTHLIGGALAVNLGPVLNAVQETLGTTAFGITFS